MDVIRPDLLKELPAGWQFAANVGVFLVVVTLSAWSFFKRLQADGLTDDHFEDGGALSKVGELLRDRRHPEDHAGA
jgi:hypothetical protein